MEASLYRLTVVFDAEFLAKTIQNVNDYQQFQHAVLLVLLFKLSRRITLRWKKIDSFFLPGHCPVSHTHTW